MVFSLTTQNKFVQPNNFGNLISVGSVRAKALNGRQIGVPQPQLGCLSVVPLTASTTNLLNATRPSGIGYITLTAGAGITAVAGIYNSYTNTTDTVYFFDTPRALVITTTGTEITTTFTIWGFDEDNVFMTENIVIGGSPATFFGKKAFAGVTRIWVNIRTTNAVSIGTSDIIGLPYYLLDNSSVINNNFGTGTVVASGQSTLVLGTSTISTTAVTTSSIIQLSRSTLNSSPALGFLAISTITANTSFIVASYSALLALQTTDVSSFNWNIVNATQGTVTPGVTATATATTGDIRGTVALPVPSNGTLDLVVTYLIAATTNAVSNENYAAVYGVPQYAAPYN